MGYSSRYGCMHTFLNNTYRLRTLMFLSNDGSGVASAFCLNARFLDNDNTIRALIGNLTKREMRSTPNDQGRSWNVKWGGGYSCIRLSPPDFLRKIFIKAVKSFIYWLTTLIFSCKSSVQACQERGGDFCSRAWGWNAQTARLFLSNNFNLWSIDAFNLKNAFSWISIEEKA